MENQLDDNFWELEKGKLREALEEEADYSGLAVEQRTIIQETILKPLDEGDKSFQKWIWFLGWALVGGLKFGFLPSEFRTNFARNTSSEVNGEDAFWFGLALAELADMVKAKQYINVALKDSSLPRGIRLASLQTKVWSHVRLGEYGEASATLNELANAVSTSPNKYRVDYLRGYISALGDYGITAGGDMPQQFPLYIDGEVVPEITVERVDSRIQDAALREAEDTLKKIQREDVTITELLSNVKPRKEIEEKRSHEEYGQKLVTKYGDWVNNLANKGDLINAEFLYDSLYDSLSDRSWRGVIIDYAKAVEGEIKAKLLPGLRNFLMKKGTTLENILPNKVQSGGSDLGYAELVLKRIAENQILTNFLSVLPKDTVSFLLNELPVSLAEVRELRNRAAHGDFVDTKDAKKMRRLVLGTPETPEKPGLLKRLHKINL